MALQGDDCIARHFCQRVINKGCMELEALQAAGVVVDIPSSEIKEENNDEQDRKLDDSSENKRRKMMSKTGNWTTPRKIKRMKTSKIKRMKTMMTLLQSMPWKVVPRVVMARKIIIDVMPMNALGKN